MTSSWLQDDPNPWQVETLEAFTFLCCPECTFKSKQNESFEAHAVENHPLAKTFFETSKEIKAEIEAPENGLDLDDEAGMEEPVIKLRIGSKNTDSNEMLENIKGVKFEYIQESDEGSSDDEENKKKYQCQMCPQEFEKKPQMFQHMRSDHVKIQCDECGTEIENATMLKLHKSIKHQTAKCEECNRVFTKHYYAKHMKTVHASKAGIATPFQSLGI